MEEVQDSVEIFDDCADTESHVVIPGDSSSCLVISLFGPSGYFTDCLRFRNLPRKVSHLLPAVTHQKLH